MPPLFVYLSTESSLIHTRQSKGESSPSQVNLKQPTEVQVGAKPDGVEESGANFIFYSDMNNQKFP